jgi:hypothetical protein
MGEVVSLDLLRQLRKEGRLRDYAAYAAHGGDPGTGPGGLAPSEYRALIDLFDLARDLGLALQMSLQPYGEGFLFRAYAAHDPYLTLFEVQKTRAGRIFEYHGRVRHQLVSTSMNFFPFIAVMRAEIRNLAILLGPRH